MEINIKSKIQEIFQKIKSFYFSKINSWPKKFSFWALIIILFVFLFPFLIGLIFIYIILNIKIENLWTKFGVVSLILIVAILIEVGWVKNLLGMNSPPEITINNPATGTVEIKGKDTIEISGKIKPASSGIEINGNKVEITEDGNFTEEVFVSKGNSEIKIIGKHGSGITKRTITIHRELTEEELIEEKRQVEEQKVRAEEQRVAREEAEKKAREEIRIGEEKRIQELADIFCLNRSKANIKYANLNDIATWLETGKAIKIRSVYNQAPSKASCKKVAEQCLEGLADWSETECKNMAERNVWIDMTSEQLIVSWGFPKKENDTVTIWGTSTQWIYGDYGPYVYLEGDSKSDLVVTGWQN